MVKSTKKVSSGTTKKSKSSVKSVKSSPVATPKRSVASTSKSGQPSPKMSGEQIEKELAMAHKVLSQAAFQINYMLSTRRVSPKRIALAAESAKNAAAYMERLQSVIQSFAQAT